MTEEQPPIIIKETIRAHTIKKAKVQPQIQLPQDRKTEERKEWKKFLRTSVLIFVGLVAAIGLGLRSDLLEKIGSTSKEGEKSAEQKKIEGLIGGMADGKGGDLSALIAGMSESEKQALNVQINGALAEYNNARQHFSKEKGTSANLQYWATTLEPGLDSSHPYSDEQIRQGSALILALQSLGLAGNSCDPQSLTVNIKTQLGYNDDDIRKFVEPENKFCRYLKSQPFGKGFMGAIPAQQKLGHLTGGATQELRARSAADQQRTKADLRSVRSVGRKT